MPQIRVPMMKWSAQPTHDAELVWHDMKLHFQQDDGRHHQGGDESRDHTLHRIGHGDLPDRFYRDRERLNRPQWNCVPLSQPLHAEVTTRFSSYAACAIPDALL